MKHLFKMASSLLLDQFIGVFSGWMLIVCVSVIFKNTLTGYLLAFCICFGFYCYVTYHTAFKSGFHDKHRIQKDSSYHGYMYKGAIAGIIAAVPLFILYIILQIKKAAILFTYFMIFDMYWTWPMANIFPNHRPAVLILAFVPMILVPWIGYIAGYKNFMISDIIIKLYRRYQNHE